MPKVQLPRITVDAPAKLSINTAVTSCWPGRGAVIRTLRSHPIDVVDRAEPDGARVG